MSRLSAMETPEGIKDSGDVLGGKFDPLASGLYKTTIKVAYLQDSPKGALGLQLELETDDNRSIRETVWLTSGTAKGGKNYYVTKSGDKMFLPGFNNANALAVLLTGKPINKMKTEEKIVDVYDPAVRTAVPTKVDMLTGLLGKRVVIGLMKRIVDINVLDPESGKYVPSGDTRIINEIDRFFRDTDGMTVTEVKAGAKKATFHSKWSTKYTGVTQDRSTKNVVKPVAVATTAAPAQQDLFA